MRTAWVVLVLAASVAHAAPRVEPPLVVAGRPARVMRDIDVRPAFDGWSAIWDHDTGVPLRLWGNFVDVPGAVRDPAIAETAARAFLAAHADVLAPGATPSDFELVANHLDGELRTVGFRQLWHGMPVVGAQLGFVFGHDHLFVVGSEAMPAISATVPRTRATDAQLVRGAETWIGVRARSRVVGRVVLPIVRGPGDIEFRIAEALDVDAGTSGRWDVYVAADGTPIARATRLRFSSATLSYDASVRYPGGTRMPFPAQRASITVNGGAAVTGNDGTFSWSTAGNATVVPSVVGALANVHNEAGAAATTSLTAAPGGTTTWSLASNEFGDAQLSTYIYAYIAKARDRLINPAVASWIDQQLDFFVNENDTCNAFSTGDDVHFFRAGNGCENTGRISDVVYHEFGHSFHNHSVIPGMGAFESNLTEGLADFNAANIVDDSGMGRGFDFTPNPLRDIDPPNHEAEWPRDVSQFDPHVTGLIISGALWDLRKAAGVATTENVFKGVMQRAADIPSSYVAALAVDDDDGNLGNGTPHQCAIVKAFRPHGLAMDNAPVTMDPPVATGLSLSVTVHTPTTPCAQIVQSVTVTWRAGTGATTSFPLAAQGSTWTGAIPEQPPGTHVEYQVVAQLDDGTVLKMPDNAADPMYALFAGTVTPIWCEMFDTDPRWQQFGSQGQTWEYGMPEGTAGDPAAAHSGDKVLGTDVFHDGRYPASDNSFVESPDLDLSIYQTARLQYWRWLTVQDGMFDQASVAAVHGTTPESIWANASNLATHVDKEWRFQDFDLGPQIAKGPFRLRWSLKTDASGELGGWNIDDVCVVTLDQGAHCGNAIVEEGEQCDDGNTTAADGCSATCTDEHVDGGCCSTSGGAGGSAVLAFGVLALALRTRRRSLQ